MTGSLNETYLTALQKKCDKSQSNIFDYSDQECNHTTLAVVSEPNDTGIVEATDEFRPELGMPQHKLADFRKVRGVYNDVDPVKCHNKAYEKCDLDVAYTSYLRYNKEANAAVEEIVRRLLDGEDITLVCFEKPPKKCHRHKLKEFIEDKLEAQTLKS